MQNPFAPVFVTGGHEKRLDSSSGICARLDKIIHVSPALIQQYCSVIATIEINVSHIQPPSVRVCEGDDA